VPSFLPTLPSTHMAFVTLQTDDVIQSVNNLSSVSSDSHPHAMFLHISVGPTHYSRRIKVAKLDLGLFRPIITTTVYQPMIKIGHSNRNIHAKLCT